MWKYLGYRKLKQLLISISQSQLPDTLLVSTFFLFLRYIYLSGWMIAAMRSEFGPLPDQSMHEKTAVPALIGEIYTFLRQADARELNKLFRALDKARKEGDKVEEKLLLAKIDNFETHIVPIIADIDAGFGNEEATYLLAKKMIEAGAACIQMENQVGLSVFCIYGSCVMSLDFFSTCIKIIYNCQLSRCLTRSSAATKREK